MYNDLGTSSKARKDDYDTVGLEQAERAFIDNKKVLTTMFSNADGEKGFGKWQTKIKNRVDLAEIVLTRAMLPKESSSFMPTGPDGIPIDFIRVIKERYPDLEKEIKEKLAKNK